MRCVRALVQKLFRSAKPEKLENHNSFIDSKSFDILTDPNTRFWSGSTRGNIFLKYPHPIETNHLQQTVIYRRLRDYQHAGTYFSMQAPDAPAEGFMNPSATVEP